MKEVEWWIVKVYATPDSEGSRIDLWESCFNKCDAERLLLEYGDPTTFRIAKVTTETLPVRKRSKR